MITSEDLNLDLNDSGIGVFGTYGPGTTLKYDFENGDDVSLKKGKINIEVQNAEKQPDGAIKGVVKFVVPYNALEADGVVEGTEIIFSYKNIFSCSKK